MSDLTTLANVKAWMGITGNQDDTLLSRLIAAASAYIETFTNRTFESKQYVEVRDGTGKQRMAFAEYPVTAVASVVVNGNPIPAAPTMRDSGYRFDSIRLLLAGYEFSRGVGNVELIYTAGYSTTPPEIEQACIELVSLRYKERDRIGHQSKSLAGETVTFMIRDFPDSVRTILNNYKKVVPL